MIFHDSPEKHLEKLRRVVARLERDEMHADDISDFCLTAWHMLEWAQKSPDREVRRRAKRLRSDPDLALCRLVATVAKHGQAKPVVQLRANLSEARVEQGWGVGRYGKGAWGIGEQHIIFKLNDGTERDGFDLARSVLAKWESVFGPTTQ